MSFAPKQKLDTHSPLLLLTSIHLIQPKSNKLSFILIPVYLFLYADLYKLTQESLSIIIVLQHMDPNDAKSTEIKKVR